MMRLFHWGRQWPEIQFSEMKKRAKLLVVDDQEFVYQGLFSNDGYTIDKWDDIEDLSKLEDGYYDLILLDMHGVGESQSSEGGLGLLKHLKKNRPSQLIIAYSAADWSLKYNEFFELADGVLEKKADYIDFKQKIDEVLKKSFSLGFYLDQIGTIAGDYSRSAPDLTQVARAAILKNSPEKLRKYATKRISDPKVISLVMQVAQVAMGVMQIWTK